MYISNKENEKQKKQKTTTTTTTIMKTAITVLSVFVVLITILLKQQGVGPHDEEALLTDWSIPPPFPIFIGINVIADTLRKIADTLTPPPVRMINMSFDYMNTALAYGKLQLRFNLMYIVIKPNCILTSISLTN